MIDTVLELESLDFNLTDNLSRRSGGGIYFEPSESKKRIDRSAVQGSGRIYLVRRYAEFASCAFEDAEIEASSFVVDAASISAGVSARDLPNDTLGKMAKRVAQSFYSVLPFQYDKLLNWRSADQSFISAVILGKSLTREVLGTVARKTSAALLLYRMWAEGVSYGANPAAGRITRDSFLAAKRFIFLLPVDLSVPRIAADGEGGVTMIWELSRTTTLVTIEDWKVHIVTSAATPDAKYFDDLSFDGQALPGPFLSAVRQT